MSHAIDTGVLYLLCILIAKQDAKHICFAYCGGQMHMYEQQNLCQNALDRFLTHAVLDASKFTSDHLPAMFVG